MNIDAIIGELVTMEKYYFVDPKIVVEVVKDTLNLIQKEEEK